MKQQDFLVFSGELAKLAAIASRSKLNGKVRMHLQSNGFKNKFGNLVSAQIMVVIKVDCDARKAVLFVGIFYGFGRSNETLL